MWRVQLAVTPTPHRFSCSLSTFDMDMTRVEHLGSSVAARTRSCRDMQDLISLDVRTHMCFCGSGVHSRYRTAGWRCVLQQVSTLTGVLTLGIAFCLCQPALCVSNLADLLLVSHINLLIPVICSFFASTRPLHVLDVPWACYRFCQR